MIWPLTNLKRWHLLRREAQQYAPIWSLGLIYLKKHDYSQAKDYFDQLPEGNATQLDNYQVMQSYAYAVMGEKAKAITLLEKTLKKYPNLDPITEIHKYMLHLEILMRP